MIKQSAKLITEGEWHHEINAFVQILKIIISIPEALVLLNQNQHVRFP